MPLVPLAEAARRLGKPERTVRRWAAQKKLVAERRADGWYIDLEGDGNAADSGVLPLKGTTQLSTIPTSYLIDLQTKAEQAAFYQGRAEVLADQVRKLEQQLALPPAPPQPRKPWWRFWQTSMLFSVTPPIPLLETGNEPRLFV